MCPGSPSSAALSGVSGECGSHLHGNLGNIMEGVEEEDDANLTEFRSPSELLWTLSQYSATQPAPGTLGIASH
jgi:hypothetical protein